MTDVGHSVVMFCPQFRPAVGGAERQAERLALALSRMGARVVVVTPRIDDESPEVEWIGGVRVERFRLVDLSRIAPSRGIGVVNLPFVLWQVASAVNRRLEGAEVLHCHIGSLQTAGAALAGRVRRIPVVCKAAMADTRSDLGEVEKTGASGRFVAWLLRALVDTWVATTEAVESALVDAGVSRAAVVRIPNGVEYGPGNPLPRQGPARRFLYLGRLSTNTERDVPSLIRAFSRVVADFPDAELALVGGGDLLEQTRQLVKEHLAGARAVHVPGFDDSEKWLRWADAFVLPSRREGLSNALLEAMASGLPCIANDIPPNREVLDHGRAGVLVPVGDVDALHDAMRRFAGDAEHVAHLGTAALERVRKEYAMTSVAKAYSALYGRINP